MTATAATQPIAQAPASSSIRPYAVTIFLSAFLLFLVQPIIAKQILPWFGGSAAVWTTCLVFFQSILLAGYAYADLTNRLGLRRQTILHIALLVLSLLTLPIIASSGWKPAGEEEPIGRILLLLLVTIGLPYFLLATTTPLLQAWYWRRFETAVPYRLFALSNFASLLALLGFPVLLEPFLSLPHLGWTWSGLYAAFVLICAGTGWMSLRASESEGIARTSASAVKADAGVATPPSAALQLLWLVLSAMGSVMLLAVTNHVTQNISSVPFLWVLPLSLYLITFILCFDHPRWYKRWIFIALLVPGIPAMAYYIPSHELQLAAILYFSGMFVACMFCHGELARLKPDPRYLTRFYLMLSLGGAIGAVLIAIVAPLTLRGYYEIGIALVALALVMFIQMRAIVPRLIALGAAIATGYLFGQGVREYLDDVRMMERDFYGVVRTRDRSKPAPYRAMLHGSIVHGGQLLGDDFKNTASDYFGPTSGYGRLFASLPADKPRNIGVIGLGAGVIAAYGRPGDTLVFYEISPKVVDLAQREFTFLKDTHAKIELVMGDGRLSLEREAPRKYDIMGIDAFSGDSIPMHLVTREAMQVYVKHLAENGVIVFQATNRYVNLMPVIKRLAAEVGMEAVLVSDSPDHANGPEYWYSSTDQVIVTKNKALLEAPRLKEAIAPIEDSKTLPTFTDHHHNLFRILK